MKYNLAYVRMQPYDVGSQPVGNTKALRRIIKSLKSQGYTVRYRVIASGKIIKVK